MLICLVLLGIVLASTIPPRFIVLNLSPSIAPGLYIICAHEPAVGQLLEFRAPQSARNYFTLRGTKLPTNWFFLKPAIAGAGDRVNTQAHWLVINGTRMARINTHDFQGRPLPIWRADRVLKKGEFFMFSPLSNSFDSRCFGPIRRDEIVAVRKPWLTW